MKKFLSLVLTALMLAAVLSVFALPASAADERFSDLSKWQGDLDPNLPITEVNLPGTHDSAMFGIGSGITEGFGFAHNQSLTFAEQLNIGVRYIDGRFCYLNKGNKDQTENIFCTHGGYIPKMDGKKITLKMLLDELNKFLDTHPTEFIYLPFKCESEEDMEKDLLNDLLASIFYELANSKSERYMLVYGGNRIPSVKEAKGHIILTPNSNTGIFSDYVSIANTYSSGTDKKVVELEKAFDLYKVRELGKNVKTFTRNNDDTPVEDRAPRLIHTSCYQFPFRTPADCSDDIKDWLFHRVTTLDGVLHPNLYSGYYYGIVLFDYVTKEECRLIVDLNKEITVFKQTSLTPENSVQPTATILGDSETVIAYAVIAVVIIGIAAVITVLAVKKKNKKNA